MKTFISTYFQVCISVSLKLKSVSIINNNDKSFLKNQCRFFKFQQQSISRDKFWQKKIKIRKSTSFYYPFK